MRKLMTLAAFAGAMALALPAGDSKAKQKGTESVAEASAKGHDRIVRQVRHELVMLPFYGVFDHFAYKVDNDKVTLLGYVTRPTLKSSAENVVKTVEGVESVDNRIEVLPVSPMDDDIRLAAYRAIYGHTALSRYSLRAVPPIHIIVKNGHVTLFGSVANEADKTLAMAQVRSVPNVFSVQSELMVDRS